MNERIDHAAKARQVLAEIPANVTSVTTTAWCAEALVHAQLAVAEQLRIGNEIALRQATFNLHPSGTVAAINDEQTVERLGAALGVSNE